MHDGHRGRKCPEQADRGTGPWRMVPELGPWHMVWRLCLQGHGQLEEAEAQRNRLTIFYQLCGHR